LIRAIDIFLQVLTVITVIGSFVLPRKISWKLLCASFFAVGLWAVLFPPGILAWARAGHRELDPGDKSLWWIPRLVGVILVGFSAAMAIAFSK
jgi:threonine/homoserine/homoserine lactone efflux protein